MSTMKTLNDLTNFMSSISKSGSKIKPLEFLSQSVLLAGKINQPRNTIHGLTLNPKIKLSNNELV